MVIRRGTVDELRSLWGATDQLTQEYFIDGIGRGNIEFWTVEDEEASALVGELYVFWDSEDNDEADGRNRAYLCAFRVNENYQGRGIGSALMKRVLQRISEKGFGEVTIGVESKAERLTSMYNSWGFSKFIKLQDFDLHNMDSEGRPRREKVPTALYLKKLQAT